MKKEREQEKSKENYPWLDPSDGRKYITDKQIQKKIYRFRQVMPNGEREESSHGHAVQVQGSIYSKRWNRYVSQYRNRDRCDRPSFFIRPYHVKEEDKNLIDEEMKHLLCYLSILKEGFSAYSSPVMLISRKLTQDKKSGDRL